jgi:hypothetical protein
MQISRAIITGGVASPNTQQITSATAAGSLTAGGSLSIAVSTMGFNTGDRLYWQSTGTTANSTGSAVVTNTLGIIGSANLSITTSGSDSGTFNVFILNSQVSGSILRQLGPISFSGLTGTYGWFAGGNTPAVSTVDRIDFANDSPTAAISRGLLTSNKRFTANTGNLNYGWVAGGTEPPNTPISKVDRIDYSNDTAAAVARGSLVQAKANHAATGNASYGWFAGGAPGPRTSIDRIDYSNDSPTTASPRGPLSTRVDNPAAVGNSAYGWWAGGWFGVNSYSTVQRVDYANDSPTSASPRGPLSLSREAAAAGNANYGWFAAGKNSTIPTIYSIVDRIDYANDSPTSASPRSPLSAAQCNQAAAGNSNYGWWAGGDDATPTTSSTVNRIDFANDTATSSTRGPLSSIRYMHGASSNYGSGVQTAPINSAGTYGWFGGGYTFPGQGRTTVDRIDFSNDSPASASPRGPLISTGEGFSATGNANYGWFSNSSNVDRIDFSNDSPTVASPRGRLTSFRTGGSATSNANFGWFGGGSPQPGNSSQIDRIDFSNDSPASASPRGPLSVARRFMGATGNANYGWFGGGYVMSYVDRVDFSNDSPSAASPRGFLSGNRSASAACGNANYGWFAGGLSTPSENFSTVNRIDFANDSPTAASPRGLLTVARRYMAAVSNANYGWFSGGSVGLTGSSLVDRIDFANDSPTAASPRGLLTVARLGLGGTSNYTK